MSHCIKFNHLRTFEALSFSDSTEQLQKINCTSNNAQQILDLCNTAMFEKTEKA